jgi:hypothetical protein
MGLISVLVFNVTGLHNVVFNSDNDSSDGKEIIKALESYYGEWEIVEDFGYHGIHRTIEIDIFEIGKIITFNERIFGYDDTISIEDPRVGIEIIDIARMISVHKMFYPDDMGFYDSSADSAYYVKVNIYDTGRLYNFYILNKDEIIIEGDINRYYRAVRKSD